MASKFLVWIELEEVDAETHDTIGDSQALTFDNLAIASTAKFDTLEEARDFALWLHAFGQKSLD